MWRTGRARTRRRWRFDALSAARARGVDVVIIDTAGRLQTKSNLMEELKKIRRALSRQVEEESQRVLLTLDATTGQNGLYQARAFAEAVECDGVFLAKLDGTAKGGIAIAVADELGLPVVYVGHGRGHGGRGGVRRGGVRGGVVRGGEGAVKTLLTEIARKPSTTRD